MSTLKDGDKGLFDTISKNPASCLACPQREMAGNAAGFAECLGRKKPMPEETLSAKQEAIQRLIEQQTPEQKQRVKEIRHQQEVQKKFWEILHRLHRFSIPYVLGCVVLWLLFIGFCFRLLPVLWLALFGGLLGSAVGGFMAAGRWYSRKVFIKQLTPEDYNVLEEALHVELSASEYNLARLITKEYRKVNPQKEYLRPSQQTQDDTLLRAATSPDTTPQEQLLRPSPTDEA